MSPAQFTDLDPILDIMGEITAWLKTKGIHQWGQPYPREKLAAEIVAGEVFVERNGGEVIGAVTLKQGDDAMSLHRLVVNRSHRGTGLGARIVTWAESEVRRRGLAMLRLDCDAANSALRNFYQSHGFKLLGARHDARYEMDFALFEKEISAHP